MEPSIQYAKTEDGVSIAYWTLGEGEPLIQMPALTLSHAQQEWHIPPLRQVYERMAERRMLIRYDGRGTGLSQRGLTTFSLDDAVRDLEAVVDQLNLERFALFGVSNSGPVAIAYACRHPERVSHLLLWCTWTAMSDLGPGVQALADLREENLRLGMGALLALVTDQKSGAMAAFTRESVTQEDLRLISAEIRKMDVTSLLPQVASPTLVLHRRDLPFPDTAAATKLASSIPDARLALLEGASIFMAEGDPDDLEAALTAINEFLGEDEEQAAAAPPAPGGFATILFTDMASSTALTEQLGDAAAQEVRRAHNDIVRSALAANGGNEIKHTGDGIMASFATASSALECAIAIQRGVAAHKEERPDSPLGVYVGLNAGEPIAEDDDLFGTSVDLAARLVDHAQPGQIIASDVVRQLAAGKQFLFSDLGETELRGFEDPVKLWEVSWRKES